MLVRIALLIIALLIFVRLGTIEHQKPNRVTAAWGAQVPDAAWGATTPDVSK